MHKLSQTIVQMLQKDLPEGYFCMGTQVIKFCMMILDQGSNYLILYPLIPPSCPIQYTLKENVLENVLEICIKTKIRQRKYYQNLMINGYVSTLV